MNIKQLGYFISIAEQGSFVKASAALHVSQPAVSNQVKLLEEDLGIQLFERRPNGVVLTPEGQNFLRHAYTIQRAVQAARDSVKAYQADAVGKVAIGMPNSLGVLLIVTLAEAVQKDIPNVQLRVVTGVSRVLQEQVMSGELDFSIVYADGPVPGADMQNILVEDLCLVASNASRVKRFLTPGGDIPLRALQDLPLVLPSTAHGLRRHVERAAATSGIKLGIKVEVDAAERIKQLVRHTDCYSVLPRAALRDESCEELAAIRIVNPSIQRILSIFHVTGRPLSRSARHVQNILFAIINAEQNRGWWRFVAPAPEI